MQGQLQRLRIEERTQNGYFYSLRLFAIGYGFGRWPRAGFCAANRPRDSAPFVCV